MPRKLLISVIKDFNDVILYLTIAPNDVVAKMKLMHLEGLYDVNPSDGYVVIRKKFKELAEPKGFKCINAEVVEIIDPSSKDMKGVKLNGKNKRAHKRTKGKFGNTEKRAGRGIGETAADIQ